MRKIILCAAAIALCIVPAFAGNGSEIIYKTGSEYQLAEFSIIESGKNTPGSQHAITRREFNYRMLDRESETKDGMTGKFGGTLNPWFGVFHSSYTGDEDYIPTQMIYVYDRMPSFLDLTLSAAYDDIFFAKLTYNVTCSKTSMTGGTGFYHPAMTSYYSAGDSPEEGYLSFSTRHFSLAMGRFKGGTGHGIMGNLFQNSQAPFYDQVQFTFYSKSFKYSYMMGSSSAKLSDEELVAQRTGGKDSLDTFEEYYITDYSKLYAFHRLEYAPSEKVTFGVGELTVVGGKSPDFDMINPMGIYHDCYDNHYHGYYFGADISWVPVNRHMIFFELLSDQIMAPGERSDDPTALGYQLGYWFILPTGTESKHRLALEMTHVDKWTYVNKTPYLSMYQRQSQRETTSDIPLGYSAGGDCNQVSLAYTVVSPSGFKLDFKASYLEKGEVSFELDENDDMYYWNASGYDSGPSGVVERWYSLDCVLKIPLSEILSLNLQGYYALIDNFQHERGHESYLSYLTGGLSISF
jgi:hypothetical protein